MNRGEVWLVDFAPQVGAEIAKQRPAVIVSATGIAGFPTRIVVPLRDRKPLHSSVQYFVGITPTPANGLMKNSTADCVQLKSLDLRRFIRKLGDVSASELDDILDGIALCIGL